MKFETVCFVPLFIWKDRVLVADTIEGYHHQFIVCDFFSMKNLLELVNLLRHAQWAKRF